MHNRALRYLIQQYSDNIRFCLICNYISKIDKALQNEFIQLCFCNLPKNDILKFLKHIIDSESLKINKNQIKNIQKMFNSDIRSMINYIQTNHNNININNIITNDIWDNLINLFKKKSKNYYSTIKNYIIEYCNTNNFSTTNFIKSFLFFIIENNTYCLNNKWLSTIELIIHNENIDEYIYLDFFIHHLYDLYNSL